MSIAQIKSDKGSGILAKIKRLSYFVCGFCLASMLFMLLPAVSSPGGYNPWADLNNDGTVDIYDAILLSNAFSTNGQNLTKLTVIYDSGWINITDKQGQTIPVTHNLNITDWNDPNIIVEITGKTNPDGSILHRFPRYFGTPSWNVTYGGTGNDWGASIIQTSDGGYAIAGTTYSLGVGDNDIWIIKTDPDGKTQWNRTYGKIGYDAAAYHSIIQTNDEGYVVFGSCSESDYPHNDLWIIKIDAEGNAQWNKTYGGTSRDEASYAFQSDDGGFVVAGTTLSSGAGASDGWLIKTDADGNMEWNKTYGGGGWDGFRSIKRTSDGGFVLAGVYETNVWDFWLVKTDANGTELWSRTYGGSAEDDAFDVVQTDDGGYALAGYAYSFGAGGRDFWLVKTDADGNMEWNKAYGGTNNEEVRRMMRTDDGGYLLAGYTSSFGAGASDAWLVKTDASGNMEWNKTYGGTNDDFSNDFIQTWDGGLALVGSTNSLGAGNYDIWLFKTNLETAVECTNTAANTVTLYRGPTDPYWNYVRIRIMRTR
jgi:hypothetical protein